MSIRTKTTPSDIAASCGIGISVASVASLTLWAATKTAGVTFETKNELAIGGTTIGAPLIVITIVAVSVVAALGFAVLNRLVANPTRPFQVVAAVAGLMSFGGPISEAVETSTLVTLFVLHVLAAAVTVWTHTLREVPADASSVAQVSAI